jgi:hypothetical protein
MTPTGSLSRAATGIAVYSVWLGFAGRGFSTQTFHRQIKSFTTVQPLVSGVMAEL